MGYVKKKGRAFAHTPIPGVIPTRLELTTYGVCINITDKIKYTADSNLDRVDQPITEDEIVDIDAFTAEVSGPAEFITLLGVPEYTILRMTGIGDVYERGDTLKLAYGNEVTVRSAPDKNVIVVTPAQGNVMHDLLTITRINGIQRLQSTVEVSAVEPVVVNIQDIVIDGNNMANVKYTINGISTNSDIYIKAEANGKTVIKRVKGIDGFRGEAMNVDALNLQPGDSTVFTLTTLDGDVISLTGTKTITDRTTIQVASFTNSFLAPASGMMPNRWYSGSTAVLVVASNRTTVEVEESYLFNYDTDSDSILKHHDVKYRHGVASVHVPDETGYSVYTEDNEGIGYIDELNKLNGFIDSDIYIKSILTVSSVPTQAAIDDLSGSLPITIDWPYTVQPPVGSLVEVVVTDLQGTELATQDITALWSVDRYDTAASALQLAPGIRTANAAVNVYGRVTLADGYVEHVSSKQAIIVATNATLFGAGSNVTITSASTSTGLITVTGTAVGVPKDTVLYTTSNKFGAYGRVREDGTWSMSVYATLTVGDTIDVYLKTPANGITQYALDTFTA